MFKKINKNINKAVIVFTIILFLTFNQAYAVPPPDFIIQVVSNLGVYFAISMAFLSSIFFSISTNLKIYFKSLGKIKLMIIGLLLISGISYTGAYFYDNYKQEQEINIIKEKMNNLNSIESEENIEVKNTEVEDIIKIENTEEKENLDKTKNTENKFISDLEDDKVKIKNFSNQEKIDFLKKYYSYIDKKKLTKAYEIGTKSVTFKTFNSWYKNIEYLKINSIEKIKGAESGYKIDLNIKESGEIINYTVFKYLGKNEKQELKITKSETVKTMKLGNSDLNKITISNEDFSKIYKDFKENNFDLSNSEIIILDAREDLEVEVGYMPGSKHIRFAELQNGDYSDLDKNKTIYVYCWSGIRGKEVALFLKSKGFNAISLEDGSKGWYEFGGNWKGKIEFSSKFNETNYKKLFMKDALQKEIKKGTTLVDIREISKYNKSHLKNSINVPLVDLPEKDWQKYIDKIEKDSKIITICDNYVNCFYAKIVGIELEKRGFEFEGRYSLAYN